MASTRIYVYISLSSDRVEYLDVKGFPGTNYQDL